MFNEPLNTIDLKIRHIFLIRLPIEYIGELVVELRQRPIEVTGFMTGFFIELVVVPR